MRIEKIQIENFRSIKNCSVRFHELTAIVGENNSGKTAILRALNCFFNFEMEELDFKSFAHRYAPRTKTKITIVFSDIPSKANYKELVDTAGKLILHFSYDYSKFSRKLQCETNGNTKTLDSSFISKLKEDVDYAYIPASRSYKDVEWGEHSVFSRLIKRYLENYTKNRDRLSSSVKRAGESFHDQVLIKLSKALTELNFYEDVGEYQINYRESIDYTVFINKLGLDVLSAEAKDLRPVSEYGSGIQSLTVIALYRFLARLNEVSIVLGIEEPETNLHPQAQRKLIYSFKNLRQSCESQAIFATHSTVIIDELKHDDIVLMRRVKDDKRGFHSEVKQIADSFWVDHNIVDLKHYNFFKYRNSDFFFAKFVILVEGIADAKVIEHLLKQKESDNLFFISIVNLDSISSFKYPYYLLHDLGIPFCAVVDKDFFTPYKNGKLDASRDPVTFLPEYSGCLGKNKVLSDIFDTSTKQNDLCLCLSKSYTKLFEHVKQFGILPMQYCLEMDLVANKASRELYFDHFELEGTDRSYSSLLIERKDIIKDPKHIMEIMNSLQPKDYPISFKKIRNHLLQIINNL